jgi:DnaK suppressor protein
MAPANESKTGRKPKALPKRLVTTLRKELEAERVVLEEQIAQLEKDFRDESWKEPRSDDDAEIGSNSFERERTMSLAQNARATVVEIDQALARMDAGSYGLCDRCGQAIPVERLEARPRAALCLDCQRDAERAR